MVKVEQLLCLDNESFIAEFIKLKDKVREVKYRSDNPDPLQTKRLIHLGFSWGAKFYVVRDESEQVIMRLATRVLPHEPHLGVIGFFEMDTHHPHREMAFATILETLTTDFKEKGVRQIAAPVDLSTWFNYRFALYDKRAWPRFKWEPTTPAAYEAIFRKHLFSDFAYYHSVFFPYFRLGSYYFGSGPLSKSYKNIFKRGFHLEPFNMQEISKDLPTLHQITHEAFTGSFLFEPLDEQTFSTLYASALQGYDYSASAKLIAPDGEIAGFIFAFYDGDYLIIKSLALRRKYQGLNLSSGMIYHCCKHSFPRKIKGTISALVRNGIASEKIEKNVNKTLWFSWSHKYILLKKDI